MTNLIVVMALKAGDVTAAPRPPNGAWESSIQLQKTGKEETKMSTFDNQMALALIRSVGASAEEVTGIYWPDVYEECGDVMVWVGYGVDKRLVTALDNVPLLMAQLAEQNETLALVQEAPDEDEAEAAQGHFAWEMYKRFATEDISQLPEHRRCEGYDGKYYDEDALLRVGDLMGGYCADYVAYLISRKK